MQFCNFMAHKAKMDFKVIPEMPKTPLNLFLG